MWALNVTGIIRNMVLVNAGYPHANEFIRKLSAILASALKNILQLCFMPKILKNMGLKGRHFISMPRAQN